LESVGGRLAGALITYYVSKQKQQIAAKGGVAENAAPPPLPGEHPAGSKNTNSEDSNLQKMNTRFFKAVAAFFSGPKFPAFMILAMLFYQIFLAVTIFSPIGESTWGRFMSDFRVWCFGYDPNTGSMQWTAAWIMLTEPIILQAIIIALWRKTLWEMLRFRSAELIPQVSAALATVSLIAGSLIWMAAADAKAEEIPPFPADRIRTTLQPPPIELTNQHGDLVKLSDYAGEVVLMTAIYSTCSTACPMIMFQAKRVIEGLSDAERADLTVMAISLDPERDSLESMAAAAAVYGMDAPKFHFLNGDPKEVNKILDQLSVARLRNQKTDEIDHVSMYFLIDRDGRIAYRLTLSDRHQVWLSDALRILLNEGRQDDLRLAAGPGATTE
jgi:protein SCO1